MPRPRNPPAEWIALAVVCVAIPPAVRTAALAAAAGTLFEAAPFVLAASLVPRGRFARVFGGVLGCGCGSIGPGALSLPALGICWLAFGPVVTLARAAAACAVRVAFEHAWRRRSKPGAPAGQASDPLGDLARLAPQALAGALAAEGLRAALPLAVLTPLGAVLVGLAGGALLGVLLPCSTGAIAIAAGLRGVAPSASAGILGTAGIVPRSSRPRDGHLRSARLGFALLAIACGLIACRGPSGFVNPRFVLPLGCAAVVAATLAMRPNVRTAARAPAAVPALLAAAMLAGSPLPDRAPAQTTLDAPYPGESLHFIGALAPRATALSQATLVRYTITCCRADAEARAVRLDRPLPAPAGAWYAVNGTLALDSSGAYVLHVASLRPLPAPADPFAYR